VQTGEIPDSEVAIVISDKADAPGLAKAAEKGVPTAIIERRGRTREEHDREIAAKLREYDVELICLAGYMRLLSPWFVSEFPNRIINIHPSLLPEFPGLDAQRQAFEAGAKVTGCTVHFVDEHLDHGKVIVQQEVLVLEEDTAESLATKILEQEHHLYVEAIRKLVAAKTLSAT
jgi:phosphoribosylglycinamide formyltransferase-1